LAASHTSRVNCNIIRGREAPNFLKYDFDGVSAAAALRHAAERGVDVAHPRVGCGAANHGPYLTVTEGVAATYNHGVLLAKQADKESRYAPALYGSAAGGDRLVGRELTKGRHDGVLLSKATVSSDTRSRQDRLRLF
jgi:hypothetical protein